MTPDTSYEFFPADVQQQIPPLYTTDKIPLEDKTVVCKFFTPWSSWTWFVFEGEQQEDDWLLFGMVHGQEKEAGYFLLSELQSVSGPAGLKIERDKYFTQKTYGELK